MATKSGESTKHEINVSDIPLQTMNRLLYADKKEMEITATSHGIIPQVIDATSPLKIPRKIFIVKQENEPTPIIIVITKDMITEYSNAHIVYPSESNKNIQDLEYKETIDTNTESNPSSQEIDPEIIDATKPRKILIIKKENEPTPIITLITQDMIDKYPNEHIVHHPQHGQSIQTIPMAMDHAYKNNGKTLSICGVSDVIDDCKRIPSALPNKKNLMHGRCNLFLVIYLWIMFIVWQIRGDNFTNTRTYCDQFKGTDFNWNHCAGQEMCDFSKLCTSRWSRWYVQKYPYSCLESTSDCKCCIEDLFEDSCPAKEFIAFYAFLGMLFVLTFQVLFDGHLYRYLKYMFRYQYFQVNYYWHNYRL